MRAVHGGTVAQQTLGLYRAPIFVRVFLTKKRYKGGQMIVSEAGGMTVAPMAILGTRFLAATLGKPTDRSKLVVTI